MKKILFLVIISLFLLVKFPNTTAEESFSTIDCGILEYIHDKVAWKPDGSYALISGKNGDIVKCDGTNCISITSDVGSNLRGIDWRPDGKYATIVGSSGTILNYDGNEITKVEAPTTENLWGVDWKNDNSYALIVGDESVLKYDGKSVKHLFDLPYGKCVSWSPKQDIALIGSNFGVYIYEGDTLSSGYENNTGYKYGITWNNNGDFALIVGAEDVIIKYDGEKFIEMPIGEEDWFMDIEWKPSGNYALIVGLAGEIIKHDGNTYERINSPTDIDLNGIGWQPNSDIALIVGGSWLRTNGGIILKCVSSGDLTPQPDLTTNHFPKINSILLEPSTVEPNSKCTITVDAIDEDPDDILIYNYDIGIGEITGTGSVIVWTAPDGEGIYPLTVTVDDGHGGIVTDGKNITVQSNEKNGNNNDNIDNNDKKDDSFIPSFEVVLVIGAIGIAYIFLVKRKIFHSN